eukprot:6079232-Pleurochrysis_carterae.AAC.1
MDQARAEWNRRLWQLPANPDVNDLTESEKLEWPNFTTDRSHSTCFRTSKDTAPVVPLPAHGRQQPDKNRFLMRL